MSRATTEIRPTLSSSRDSDDVNNAVLALSGSHEGAEESSIRLLKFRDTMQQMVLAGGVGCLETSFQ